MTAPLPVVRRLVPVLVACLALSGCQATSAPAESFRASPSQAQAVTDPAGSSVPTTAPSIDPTPAVSPAPTPAPSASPTDRPVATTRPTPAPTVRPTPGMTTTPTAAPTTTPRPTAVASRLVRHGDRDSARVALTFDMGGRVAPAVEIMRWLTDRDVPATIFMTGAMAASQNTDAGRDVLAMVAARPDLFELGNHSYDHTDFRKLSAAAIADQLERTEAAIEAASGLDPRPCFRPPYGGTDADVLAAVGGAGYQWTILWDVDTIDWRRVVDGGPTAADIVAKVSDRAQPGSIVLMHLGGWQTLDALPGILAAIADAGLEPATIRDLLGR